MMNALIIAQYVVSIHSYPHILQSLQSAISWYQLSKQFLIIPGKQSMNRSNIITKRIWTALFSLFLVIFFLLSLNSVLPLKWQFPAWRLSAHLTTKTQKTSEGTRKDYVNSLGVITVALDKNYATVIKTMDENGNCVLERYFDNHGKPAILDTGSSALRREYDSEGRWISTTYLDSKLNPVVTNHGYALVRRTYNENGKVETEMYFDADGLPALDSYKKYGIRYEYNEDSRIAVTTNLDAGGNAMNNKDQYAIGKRFYSSDGKLYMVMYYDTDGKPAKLGYGQSGYTYINGSPICIDENGRRMFILRHFLLRSTFTVLVIGILLLLLIMFAGRTLTWILLLLYLAFIAYMTVINREAGNGVITWDIPLNYYLFFKSRDLLANTWLFIPLGAILYKQSHIWEIIAIPAALSLIIETSQLILGIGAFEVSDLITNTLGGIIGVIICYLLEPLIRNRQ